MVLGLLIRFVFRFFNIDFLPIELFVDILLDRSIYSFRDLFLFFRKIPNMMRFLYRII